MQRNWLTTAGVRLDDNSTFGSQLTYRVTTTYQYADNYPRLKATYGTGFRAPLLYELYDPNTGNPNLKPERSSSWDAGFEKDFLHGRAAFSATYFSTDYDNLIEWVLTNPTTYAGSNENVASASARGVELVASYHPSRKLDMNLNYTNTDALASNGQPLEQQPRNHYGAAINYRWTPKLSLNLNGVMVGQRWGSFVGPELPDYILVNPERSYTVATAVRAFLRVDNLLNKDYQEFTGYATARRSVNGGVSYTF